MARMTRATLERLRRDVEQGQGRSGRAIRARRRGARAARPVEDHRLTRADGRQKVSLTVVLGMILRLIGTNPPQEPPSAVFWLWKLS